MLYAVDAARQRIRARPQLTALCPFCDQWLIAKCGEINVWHWAHRGDSTACDDWAEPESLWHAHWKEEVPPDWCEVSIGRHRADIRRPDGLVVELQHSYLSPEDVRERESAYGRMVWLWDVGDAAERLTLRRRGYGHAIVQWSRPRWSILSSSRPLFLDTQTTFHRGLSGDAYSIFEVLAVERGESGVFNPETQDITGGTPHVLTVALWERDAWRDAWLRPPP